MPKAKKRNCSDIVHAGHRTDCQWSVHPGNRLACILTLCSLKVDPDTGCMWVYPSSDSYTCLLVCLPTLLLSYLSPRTHCFCCNLSSLAGHTMQNPHQSASSPSLRSLQLLPRAPLSCFYQSKLK
jgi:hypothetical protein